MKNWLSNPKVRLGLIVNGLYLFSLFTPSAPHRRPRLFAHAREARAARAAPAPPPVSDPRDPRVGRAMAHKSHAPVTLEEDLTLVRKPGRTLLFSPFFAARARPSEEPPTAVLRFIIFSDREGCPGDCPLTIEADGQRLWPNRAAYGERAGLYTWRRDSVPHSSVKLADGRVVETVAAETFSLTVPYDMFLNIIAARHVRIGLGPESVWLTADQLASLRDLNRRLPRP